MSELLGKVVVVTQMKKTDGVCVLQILRKHGRK